MHDKSRCADSKISKWSDVYMLGKRSGKNLQKAVACDDDIKAVVQHYTASGSIIFGQ